MAGKDCQSSLSEKYFAIQIQTSTKKQQAEI